MLSTASGAHAYNRVADRGRRIHDVLLLRASAHQRPRFFASTRSSRPSVLAQALYRALVFCAQALIATSTLTPIAVAITLIPNRQ